MKKIISLFCLIVIFTMSCKKDQIVDNDTKLGNRINEIANANFETQITFTKENLQIITLEIAKLAQSKEFRDFVREETSKKFDTEYEVLINDLMKNSIWRDALNNPNLQTALENFKDIDGNNYYPHIYIPKMQNREDNGLTVNEVKNELKINDQLPTFVYSACDGMGIDNDRPDIFQGYKLSSTSTELIDELLVNEDYANNNEVWVIALNESVRNKKNDHNEYYLMTDLGDADPNNGGGGNSGGNSTGGDIDPIYANRANFNVNDITSGQFILVNCKITDMAIGQHKESWVSGASEVSIKAALKCHNNRHNGFIYPTSFIEYQSDREGDRRGVLIRKFKRKEVRNGDLINVDFSLQKNWPAEHLSAPMMYDFYVFEADDWPSEKHTAETARRNDFNFGPFDPENTIPYNEKTWKDEYRSGVRKYEDWHYPYISGTICNTSFLFSSNTPLYTSARFHKPNYINFYTASYH